MSKTVMVFTIPNNNVGRRPRQPLVQIMDNRADTGSIYFHPRHAAKIAAAIKAAAKAANAGRRRKTSIIEVAASDQD